MKRWIDVASGFTRIIREHGPDAVAFYVSGQLLTEDYYVANKLMKGFIGTANIDTNSRLCMSSAVAGHKRAFGEDVVPGCYEDFELRGPHRAGRLEHAPGAIRSCISASCARRSSGRRCKIVVIDPRRTPTCDVADLHLPLARGHRRVAVQRPARVPASQRAHGSDASSRRTPTAREAHWRCARDGRRRRRRRADVRRSSDALYASSTSCSRAPTRGHRVLAGREPVLRGHRQGQQHHQLPPAHGPHRQAGHGAVLDHRPAQRDGRARSRAAWRTCSPRTWSSTNAAHRRIVQDVLAQPAHRAIGRA